MLTEKIQLDSDEEILTQVRKHWFILFTKSFGLFLAALAPLFLFFILSTIGSGNLSAGILEKSIVIGVFAYTVWLLILWMALFNVWTNYYLDIWTITNKRLIAIDQKRLFHRSVGSFRLERLQDMNVDINGIIPTLLDFGTLEAQTAAGSEEEFKADGLPKPRELKALILRATDDRMEEKTEKIPSDGL